MLRLQASSRGQPTHVPHMLRAGSMWSTRPSLPSESGSIERSYRRCREITRAGSRTFYLASLFLPAHKRRAVWAIYAFCRTADDIADTADPAEVRVAKLDDWQRELVAAFSGRPRHPLMMAVADTARRYGVSIQPALNLLQGARADITVQRYATYEQLLEYCYLVASTVGLLVSPVLGYAPGALDYGDRKSVV